MAPAAASRPSIREARSKTRSASVVSPAVKPVSVPPWPGSTTIRRPIRCGPLSTREALCRSSWGRPPVTLRPSWRSARRVAGPAGAVGRQPVVALEGPQAGLGLGSEDAVCPPGVVAEFEQPLLQRGDVVAPHQPLGVVPQQPVAQRPARLRERPVGLLADPAVDRETAHLLEVADGELGRRIELGGVRPRRRARRRRGRAATGSMPRLSSAACTSATAGPRSPGLSGCIWLSAPIVF